MKGSSISVPATMCRQPETLLGVNAGSKNSKCPPCLLTLPSDVPFNAVFLLPALCKCMVDYYNESRIRCVALSGYRPRMIDHAVTRIPRHHCRFPPLRHPPVAPRLCRNQSRNLPGRRPRSKNRRRHPWRQVVLLLYRLA